MVGWMLATAGAVPVGELGVAVGTVIAALLGWQRYDTVKDRKNGNGNRKCPPEVVKSVAELHDWHFGATPMGMKRPGEAMKEMVGHMQKHTTILQEHTTILKSVLKELRNGGSVRT